MTRTARVRALAKINLDLRVLGKRPDGYHEIRTVFQTISLSDSLEITFTRSRRTSILVESSIEIKDNLVKKAAETCLDAMRASGRVEVRLKKAIPIGAGLGGGSSDAAATLLALPVLAGRALPLEQLLCLAHGLGSDVPFFLLGGTAVGLGRGGELYPIADAPAQHGVLVASGVHVSTAEAYRSLNRGQLTCDVQQNTIDSFQSQWWTGGGSMVRNDFEPAIFAQHPRLGSLKRKLARLGAATVLMSGSGSSVYGLFREPEAAVRALQSFQGDTVFPISLVNRKRYRSIWWSALRPHAVEGLWPPRSRRQLQ